MSHAGDRRRLARARYRASLCLAALGLLAAPACSTSKEYCEQLCDCQGGCADAQLDACVEDLNADYSDAASDGCKEQADDYLTCLATEPECRAGVLDTSRCDDEVSALATCRRITVGSGGSGVRAPPGMRVGSEARAT
ncbi:MAG: hypothetical protein WKG00_12695 [Polyangiaceae bacterium]